MFSGLLQIGQLVVQMYSMYLEKRVYLQTRAEAKHLPQLTVRKPLGAVSLQREGLNCRGW
jgi:hypothetical protein